MYLEGVSVRRMEDIAESLQGSKVTVSNLYKKEQVHIEDQRNLPLQNGHCSYAYMDEIYPRRNWGGAFENVAIAVNKDGYHEVLGAAEGMKEDNVSLSVAPRLWSGQG